MADTPKDVKDHLKTMKAASKALDALISTTEKSGDAPLLLDAARRTLRPLWDAVGPGAGRDAVTAWVDALTGSLTGPVADAQAVFGAELEDALGEAGLPLRGRWPEWMCGPFRIRARPEHGEASLDWGPGAEPLGAAPLDAAEVAARIPKLAEDLKKRHDPAALPARLLTAWRMGLAADSRADGDVPLADLVPLVALQAQGKRFRERPSRAAWSVPYDRVQLSYDLARLRTAEHDGMALRLRVATRDQTRRRGPLWLPDDAVGGGTLFAAARFERRRT